MTQQPDDNTTLVSPTTALEAAFQAFAADFTAAGEPSPLGSAASLARDDFPAYVRRLEDYSRGVNLPIRLVPQDT